MIVTLLFFYISGIIFVFGGELNVVPIARRKHRARPAKPHRLETRSFARKSS